MTSPSPTTFSPTSFVELGATRSGVIQLRREWPAGDPRAVVVLVHGMSEHSGRYEHVGRYLSARGLGVVSFDQRGFGQSGGRRGWIANFDDFVDDIEDHLEQARGIGVPVVLAGHSMGGTLVTRYATSERPQPDLFVVSGPALAAVTPSAALERVPGLLAPLLGGLRSPSPFPTSVLSRDRAVCDAYDADPLVDTRVTFELLASFVDAAAETRANLDRIRRPMLALAGEADELVPPVSTRLLDGRDGIDTRYYPECRHELFNELDWQAVLDDVIDWITARLD